MSLNSEDEDPISMEQLDEDLEKFQQDELVQAALSKGVDLRQYSGQIERDLKKIENESVREYVGESGHVVELHEQIQACDVVLARMQEMLLGFQADLGGISDEIRHLQDQVRLTMRSTFVHGYLLGLCLYVRYMFLAYAHDFLIMLIM
jgi:hypothetical protein